MPKHGAGRAQDYSSTARGRMTARPDRLLLRPANRRTGEPAYGEYRRTGGQPWRHPEASGAPAEHAERIAQTAKAVHRGYDFTSLRRDIARGTAILRASGAQDDTQAPLPVRRFAGSPVRYRVRMAAVQNCGVPVRLSIQAA